MSRLTVLALVLAAGCGDNRPAPADEPDAAAGGPDAAVPVDPFAGMFESPAALPRDACAPGSLAGFAANAVWPHLPIRTAVEDGALRTFVSDDLGEIPIDAVLTADDLFVRHVAGTMLTVVDICAVKDGTTVRGTTVECHAVQIDDAPVEVFCQPRAFDTPPLRRIAGEAEGEHLTLLGEVGAGWAPSSNVRVHGPTAFLAATTDGLRIVDITDPAHPIDRGHLATPNDFANDLELTTDDGRLYAITASSPCNVIDVTDPLAPALVAQLPVSAHTLTIDGGLAYLVDSQSSTLDIWDVSAPRAPRHVATWTHPAGVNHTAWHDLRVEDGLAYLSDIGVGASPGALSVVDVSNPAAPVLVKREPGTPFTSHTPWLTTTSAGRRLVLESSEFGDGVRILDGDRSAPTFLATLGAWSLRDDITPAHDIMGLGDRAYMAHYRDGIRVLDVSDPTSPTPVAYFNTWREDHASAALWDGAFGIDLDPVRQRIYVADATRGLLVLQGDDIVFPLSSAR